MDYAGPAFDPAEGERLAGIIGDKKILFMASHGVCTVGSNAAEAYDSLYYIERAAQVQLYAMWTGQKLRELSPVIIQKTLEDYSGGDYGGIPHWQYHFDALKRILDRQEPDYRD
jgi:ribulose-5-phosphate 4-epimerase/fuculose-1-phosphate aldolase